MDILQLAQAIHQELKERYPEITWHFGGERGDEPMEPVIFAIRHISIDLYFKRSSIIGHPIDRIGSFEYADPEFPDNLYAKIDKIANSTFWIA